MLDVSSNKTLLCKAFQHVAHCSDIQVTSATAERAFSALRWLKFFLRSLMTQSRLNHVMLLHIYEERTDNIDLTAIAKEFVSREGALILATLNTSITDIESGTILRSKSFIVYNYFWGSMHSLELPTATINLASPPSPPSPPPF